MIRVNNRSGPFSEKQSLCLAGAALARGCTASTLNPKKTQRWDDQSTWYHFIILWFFPIGALESATKKFFQSSQWDGHPIPQRFSTGCPLCNPPGMCFEVLRRDPWHSCLNQIYSMIWSAQYFICFCLETSVAQELENKEKLVSWQNFR